MKLLIVGRTGTGKDTLKEILQKKYGWKFVLSKTTRKPRFEGENTHIFITQEEADATPASDKVAVTFIQNGENHQDEYFATRQQVEEADGYIIDPNGVAVLLKNMPDTIFEIVYLSAISKELQKEMAIKRANGDESAGKTFDQRYDSENEQFTKFEESIASKSFGADNCKSLMQFTNDYSQDSLEQLAFDLNCRKQMHTNLMTIVTDLKNHKVLNTNREQLIRIFIKEEDDTVTEKLLTNEQFVQILTSDDNGFTNCLRQWVSMPDTVLSKSKSTNSELDITPREYIKNILEGFADEYPDIEDKFDAICNDIVNDDNFHSLIDNYINEVIRSYME